MNVCSFVEPHALSICHRIVCHLLLSLSILNGHQNADRKQVKLQKHQTAVAS